MTRFSILCFVLALVLATNVAAQTTIRVREVMSTAEFKAAGLEKLSPDELTALDAWFNRAAATIFAYGAASTSTTTPGASSGTLDIAGLEGAIIVADDGEFLGKITSNQFDSQSLLNQFGKAGNEFSSTSMLNQFSKYGNPFSALSPFNQFTSTPPRILKGDRIVGYLIKNVAKTPRLDPDVLMGWIKANR